MAEGTEAPAKAHKRTSMLERVRSLEAELWILRARTMQHSNRLTAIDGELETPIENVPETDG